MPREQLGVQGRRPVKDWALQALGVTASLALRALGLPWDRLEEGAIVSLSELEEGAVVSLSEQLPLDPLTRSPCGHPGSGHSTACPFCRTRSRGSRCTAGKWSEQGENNGVGVTMFFAVSLVHTAWLATCCVLHIRDLSSPP